MKNKTLGWIQLILGILVLLQQISIIFNGSDTVFYQIGSQSSMIFIGIFILVTAINVIKKSK